MVIQMKSTWLEDKELVRQIVHSNMIDEEHIYISVITLHMDASVVKGVQLDYIHSI